MNYEALIQTKIKEIEAKENVKILHAVESGSRAWGFASPDSDYDVRFIYVRPKEFYLGLQSKTDYIDWELNEILDINGWDISKVLQHVHKANATIYEWANSPIVYYTTPEWEQMQECINKYFSCKSAIYHYYGTANKNYLKYLLDDMVKYKKYFYVLRSILACKWIEKKQCPPPVLFQDLVDEVLDESMQLIVAELVAKKVQMVESEKGVRIDKLNAYIVENLEYFKEKAEAMADDRNEDWAELNRVFINLLC
ncbi:MAG: nucleotidyltransferase domain-containing protein [Clostridia bacterium]|nr:nucleotidyltransferase domain-containing protein [Clostridia bacterium]